uniref:Uncharacterized protein n=1 Tax=Timema poppense TaxID=170557 RepID=A0A7R9HCM6_TIMPO|nr:unnamed protein product [Timema poppensis]
MSVCRLRALGLMPQNYRPAQDNAHKVYLGCWNVMYSWVMIILLISIYVITGEIMSSTTDNFRRSSTRPQYPDEITTLHRKCHLFCVSCVIGSCLISVGSSAASLYAIFPKQIAYTYILIVFIQDIAKLGIFLLEIQFMSLCFCLQQRFIQINKALIRLRKHTIEGQVDRIAIGSEIFNIPAVPSTKTRSLQAQGSLGPYKVSLTNCSYRLSWSKQGESHELFLQALLVQTWRVSESWSCIVKAAVPVLFPSDAIHGHKSQVVLQRFSRPDLDIATKQEVFTVTCRVISTWHLATKQEFLSRHVVLCGKYTWEGPPLNGAMECQSRRVITGVPGTVPTRPAKRCSFLMWFDLRGLKNVKEKCCSGFVELNSKNDYTNSLRMSSKCFQRLLSLVGPKQDMGMRASVPVEEILIATLRFLEMEHYLETKLRS